MERYVKLYAQESLVEKFESDEVGAEYFVVLLNCRGGWVVQAWSGKRRYTDLHYSYGSGEGSEARARQVIASFIKSVKLRKERRDAEKAERKAQFEAREGRRPQAPLTLPGWNAANLESLPPSAWRTVHQDVTAWLDVYAATFSASIVASIRASDPDIVKISFVVQVGEDVKAFRFGQPLETSVTPLSDEVAAVIIALPSALPMGEDATITVTRARPLTCDGAGFLGFHMCGISSTMSWLQEDVMLRSAEATHDPSTVDLHVRTPAKTAAAAQGVPKGVDTLPNGELMWHFQISQPTDNLGFAVGDYKPADYGALPAKGNTPAVPPVRVNMRGYNVGNVDTIADLTRDVTGYFGVWFCPFPWQQLQMTMLADDFGGGLSQQSGIFASGSLFSPSPDDWQWLGSVELLSHEIAHQWWGNYVQPMQYGDVSLSESLAEFSACLYTEHKLDTRHLEVSDNIEYVFKVPTKSDAALGSAAIYNSASYVDIVYHKGAVVFHMLRRQIGEQAMQDTLHAWTTKYGNDFATVTNFRQVTEKTTGQNLSWFLKQWFEKKGKIQAEVSSRVVEDAGVDVDDGELYGRSERPPPSGTESSAALSRTDPLQAYLREVQRQIGRASCRERV